MVSSGQRRPSGKDLQHSEAIGPYIGECKAGQWTPPMSATNVKGLGWKTGLKVILFPKTGDTGGEGCQCCRRRWKERLEKEEGSRKQWDCGSDEKKCCFKMLG